MIFFLRIFCFFPLLSYTIYATEKITILTYPVAKHSPENWHHPAVTNSLLRGLQELGVNYNYNPSKLSEVGSTVVVLANIDALKQAIEWKRTGTIKKLLAGPNLVVSPQDHHGIIASTEIDRYMVNSNWTKTAYLEDAPQLARNITIWPAGVDVRFWDPSQTLSEKQTTNVLVYWKTESEAFCNEIEQSLKKNSWNPVRIKYGQYTIETFKRELERCIFAVFISRSESQGLALAEAWAMDVPTLVWNPQELTFNGRTYSESSACPYLSTQNGYDWKTIQEFEAILKIIPTNLHNFTPRSWTLQHMSDAACAEILLALVNSIKI